MSRCGITDQGGAALLSSLGDAALVSLNISWNALRGDSARAFKQTMGVNGTLQRINLSYNGLSDQDAAIILMGLTQHGERQLGVLP